MHKNSLANLQPAKKTLKKMADKPVQVRIEEEAYLKWMRLPVEVRNHVLRNAIAETVSNDQSLVEWRSR